MGCRSSTRKLPITYITPQLHHIDKTPKSVGVRIPDANTEEKKPLGGVAVSTNNCLRGWCLSASWGTNWGLSRNPVIIRAVYGTEGFKAPPPSHPPGTHHAERAQFLRQPMKKIPTRGQGWRSLNGTHEILLCIHIYIYLIMHIYLYQGAFG